MVQPSSPLNPPSQSGLIIRQREPLNLEFPFHELHSVLTPTPLFYVRSHFAVPNLTRAEYKLTIDGLVSKPLSFRYAELLELPPVTMPATLECAGNGRVFLTPAAEGAQWQLGAVSTAEWTGVPLRLLLEMAGLSSDAVEVVFEGADVGTPKEQPRPPHPIAYARSLPRAKAMSSDVLIAYRMNGVDLPPEHGFPVRLVVAGHYGMASVKWLTRISALSRSFDGYWQTSDYAYWEYLNGQPVRVPLGELAIKSQIARPGMYESVCAGQTYQVLGACWSGDREPVSAVQVSTDDGHSWQPAALLDDPQPHVWRRWSYPWSIPSQPGRHKLRSRAFNANGKTQPLEHDDRFGSYVINHSFAIEVVSV